MPFFACDCGEAYVVPGLSAARVPYRAPVRHFALHAAVQLADCRARGGADQSPAYVSTDFVTLPLASRIPVALALRHSVNEGEER